MFYIIISLVHNYVSKIYGLIPLFIIIDVTQAVTHTQTIIVQTSEQNSIETNPNSDDNDDEKHRKVKLLVPSIKVKSCIENKREDKRRKFIEQVTAYKCRICNELGTY